MSTNRYGERACSAGKVAVLRHRSALAVLFLFAVAIALSSGCASNSSRPGYPALDAPLPYSVGVFVDPAAFPVDPPGDTEHLTFRRDPATVASIVASALDEYEVTSDVEVIQAASRAEALEAARGLDLLLAVGLDAPSTFDEYTRPAGSVALEIVLWLFGGIPSWFLPSVHYDTRAHMNVEIAEVGAHGRVAPEPGPEEPTPAGVRHEVQVDSEALSLWDRSDPLDRPLDYLQTIIMPPMFVLPGNREQASDALTEKLTADLADSFARGVREHLAEKDYSSPIRVHFLMPPSRTALDTPDLEVRFQLMARGPVELAALDVYLLSPRVRPTRWVAEVEDLERWNDALARTSTATVEIPARLRLEPGRNTVKIRFLRTNGERASRTVVYYLDGEDS